jgi:hypothetical protein
VADVVDLAQALGQPIDVNLRVYTTDTATTALAFNLIDANHDGSVSPDEILAIDGGSPILLGFLQVVGRVLAFDIPGDAGSFPLITLTDLESVRAPPLFSYESLRMATNDFVTKTGVANGLNAKLSAAEAAEARGDAAAKAGAIRAYINQLSAQSGKTLTAREAHALAIMAGEM